MAVAHTSDTPPNRGLLNNALSFNHAHARLDPQNDREPRNTYASKLRRKFMSELEKAAATAGISQPDRNVDAAPNETTVTASPDAERTYRAAAIKKLGESTEFRDGIRSAKGIKWGRIQSILSKHAPSPDIVGDPFDWAYPVVKDALNELLGPPEQGWSSYIDSDRKTWIKGKSLPTETAGPDLFASSSPDDEPPS